MGSIFLNDGVDELLSRGSAAQQADAPLELGHERHRVPDQVPPLDRRVPHLPTCKFPVNQRGKSIYFLEGGNILIGQILPKALCERNPTAGRAHCGLISQIIKTIQSKVKQRDTVL